MPDQSAEGVPQVQVRDVLALLFAVLCGLLLGIAAAPSVLPKLGFAVFTPYVVESRTRLKAEHPRTASAPPANVAANVSHAAPVRTKPSSQPQLVTRTPGSRPVTKRVASSRLARLRAQAAADQPPPLLSLRTLETVPLQSMVALAMLFFILILWLRRDMFATLLCRWAKDPRQWRSTPAAALVNARCVLYLEGNAYRLGSEFFAQAVEVRYSPLFVRINVKGSGHALVVPRRMPKPLGTRRSEEKAAAG